MIDLTAVYEFIEERERIISEGTLEQVIDLAKQFHINETFEQTTTPYKITVDKIKQRLTKEHYDWTTL